MKPHTDGLGTAEPTRYITLWRKPDDILDWDFHVSMDADEAKQVVANIMEQGAKQHRTYVLGCQMPELSSEY